MERSKSLISGTSTYLREVLSELKKVVWPSWDRTVKLTGVVISTVAVVAAFLSILDWPLGLGMQRFLGR